MLSLQQTWVLTPVLYGWRDTSASSIKFQALEREVAKGSDQPEADRSCDHQLLFVFVLGKPVLSASCCSRSRIARSLMNKADF